MWLQCNECNELAGTAHFEPLWRAKSVAQTFESAIAELIINKKWVTGDIGAALQISYKADDDMKTELTKTIGWERDLFDTVS